MKIRYARNILEDAQAFFAVVALVPPLPPVSQCRQALYEYTCYTQSRKDSESGRDNALEAKRGGGGWTQLDDRKKYLKV
jgi:hypothetical protein